MLDFALTPLWAEEAAEVAAAEADIRAQLVLIQACIDAGGGVPSEEMVKTLNAAIRVMNANRSVAACLPESLGGARAYLGRSRERARSRSECDRNGDPSWASAAVDG